MTNFQISTPIIIYFIRLLSENHSLLNNYVYRILFVLGIFSPVRLIVSIVIQPIIGIEYQQHYREIYPELKSYLASHNIELYGADKIHEFVNKIKSRMCAWKLLLFQAKLLREHWPHLSTCVNDNKAKNKNENVLDIDVTTLQSSSSKKEGAEPGYNKKSKGKPCYQLSASFIGKIFVDGKLFPGHCNPKNFFQKAVKRAISLGLNFRIVRGDTAYGSLDNLLFLTELCLGYTLGISKSFSAVKEGIHSFKTLARKKSSEIISVAKGISIWDAGFFTFDNGVKTRIIIVRRISRRKNKSTGKWKIRTYYYAIATNLELAPAKLYKFYHGRQCIEAGFRELKNHYYLERLPFRSLIANEFWIICKMLAMTFYKIFQFKTLPKKQQSLLLKTFIRTVLQQGLRIDSQRKVVVVPKMKYTWLLRRLVTKTERMKLNLNLILSVS